MADVVDVLTDDRARITRESFADEHIEFVPQHVVRRLDLEFVSPEPPVVGEDDGVVVALLEDSSGDVIVELRVRDDGERNVCPLQPLRDERGVRDLLTAETVDVRGRESGDDVGN